MLLILPCWTGIVFNSINFLPYLNLCVFFKSFILSIGGYSEVSLKQYLKAFKRYFFVFEST